VRLPSGGEVVVASGVAVTKGEIMPLVRLRTERDGVTLDLYIRPVQARRIGLDLLSAAVAAQHDAAIRTLARGTGMDGDSIVAAMKAGTESIFAVEGEVE
jgi:hypothetical protein